MHECRQAYAQLGELYGGRVELNLYAISASLVLARCQDRLVMSPHVRLSGCSSPRPKLVTARVGFLMETQHYILQLGYYITT